MWGMVRPSSAGPWALCGCSRTSTWPKTASGPRSRTSCSVSSAGFRSTSSTPEHPSASYGTIRLHQERHYPGRVSGTDLFLPDIPALARAYGGTGETATETEGAKDAIARALAAPGLSLVELVTDPQALSTSQTLDQARAAGEAALSRS